MEIRRATTGDIAELARLLEQVLEVHHAGRPDLFKGGTRKYDDGELAEILADEARPVFVAHADGEPEQLAGHAFCELQQRADDNIRTPIRTLYVHDICVDEAVRGQGVGRALYERVEAFARELGCHDIMLNVWECNPGAKAFYEALGLVPYQTGMEKILGDDGRG